MQFLYLLLAHLTADFLLQPQKLVDAKHKTMMAVGLHVVVHFFIMMLFLFPFWMHIDVLIVSGVVAFVHAVIDFIKVKAENYGNKYVFYFFVDQISHVSLLVMAAVLMSDAPIMKYEGWFLPLQWYLNPFVIFGVCLLIIASYVSAIAKFQFVRRGEKKFKPNRKRMLRNVILVSAVYGLIVVFGAYKIAAFALSPFLV